MIKFIDIIKEIKDKIIKCKKCKWEWKLSEGGKDPYVCHKCGHDNTKYYKKL
jgi:hypothetical protein